IAEINENESLSLELEFDNIKNNTNMFNLSPKLNGEVISVVGWASFDMYDVTGEQPSEVKFFLSTLFPLNFKGGVAFSTRTPNNIDYRPEYLQEISNYYYTLKRIPQLNSFLV